MAEAIGIAGILGVIDVSLKVTKELIQYTNNVKKASQTVQLLQGRARSLQSLLERAVKAIESCPLGDTGW
jgi:hypothetical protein